MTSEVISCREERENGVKGLRRLLPTNKGRIFILAFTLALLGITLLFFIDQEPGSDEILKKANLAVLPHSLSDIKVDTRSLIVSTYGHKQQALFNRRVLLIKFQADPNVIDSFLDNSPAINKNVFHPLKPIHASLDAGPDWWWANQSSIGRTYQLQEHGDILGGRIFVDDESNTVRIAVAYIANQRLEEAVKSLYNFRETCADYTENVIQRLSELVGD